MVETCIKNINILVNKERKEERKEELYNSWVTYQRVQAWALGV